MDSLSTFTFVEMPHLTQMVENELIIKYYEFAEFYFPKWYLLISLDTLSNIEIAKYKCTRNIDMSKQNCKKF